jgi:hypothetical protein
VRFPRATHLSIALGALAVRPPKFAKAFPALDQSLRACDDAVTIKSAPDLALPLPLSCGTAPHGAVDGWYC